MRGPNQAGNAIVSGRFWALVQGGIFKVQAKSITALQLSTF